MYFFLIDGPKPKAISAYKQVVSFTSYSLEAELNSGNSSAAQHKVTAVAARILPATGTLRRESNGVVLQRSECFAVLQSRRCICICETQVELRVAAKHLNASLANILYVGQLTEKHWCWWNRERVAQCDKNHSALSTSTIDHFAACFEAEHIQVIYSSCWVS